MYIPANKEITKAEVVALNTTLSAIEESCKQDGYDAECYFIEAEDGDPDLEEGIQIDIQPSDDYSPKFYFNYRSKTGFSFKIQTTSYGSLNLEQFDEFNSANEKGYRLAKGIYGFILRCVQLIRKEEVQITSSKKAIKSSKSWDDFNRFSDILDEYLPASGEGETMASQVATAVSKLVYKWFNDGDVYDNTHQLEGWANDLSTYANWLYKYAGAKFLDEIEDAESEGDYENILYSLCENLAVPEKLVDWDNEPKVGSVYKCEGPFKFVDREDEYDWDDEDDEE